MLPTISFGHKHTIGPCAAAKFKAIRAQPYQVFKGRLAAGLYRPARKAVTQTPANQSEIASVPIGALSQCARLGQPQPASHASPAISYCIHKAPRFHPKPSNSHRRQCLWNEATKKTLFPSERPKELQPDARNCKTIVSQLLRFRVSIPFSRSRPKVTILSAFGSKDSPRTRGLGLWILRIQPLVESGRDCFFYPLYI